MPSYRFYQVDVFTNQAFGGNPLAVFPDAEGLSPDDMHKMARALGLPTGAISEAGYPVMWVSTGIRQLFAPIRSLPEIQGIQSSKVDAALLGEVCTALDPATNASLEVMVVCKGTVHQTSTVHTRMLAPGIGLPEDPATGSASGGLGADPIGTKVIQGT